MLDTNVWVAAGFNPGSSSAAILADVERGRLELVWDRDTRRETERVVRRIPRLSWERFAPLFDAGAEHAGLVEADAFGFVEDPGDRKFAALAAAAGAVLVTNDDHLLAHRGRAGTPPILTPAAFVGGDAGGT